MKLYISNSGLMEPIKQMISNAKNNLTLAKNNCINAPSSFRYRAYVNNLDDSIREYINELKYLESAIIRSEKNYEEFWDDSKRKVDSVDDVKITERTGMIV